MVSGERELAAVDFHIHVGKMDKWHPWVQDYMGSVNPDLKRKFNSLMVPEKLVKYLKAEGVDIGVVHAEVAPVTTGIVSNEYVSEFCKGQKSLVPFASINPNMTANPAKELERCVTELGSKGVKLYPTYQQYYPNQQNLYPVYAKAQELKVPVMFHTGSSVYSGARLKYGDPLYIDDVAVDFPDLNIVMAHGGRGFWYDKAFFLTRMHRNVYMEISGLPPRNLLKYYPDLEKISDKTLFGSDFPGTPGIGKTMDEIRLLPLRKKTVDNLLGENARRLLRM